ncbi:Retinoic acid receptor beta [Aphelenchoides avenae]|nr:Retinoic acid receptor beta [Aphelenchus avenae]
MTRAKISPCRVCSDEAKCRHFGVACCESCSSFFRRAMSTTTIYVCRKNRRCPPNKTPGRKRCSHCRLQQCFTVGMVLPGKGSLTTAYSKPYYSACTNVSASVSATGLFEAAVLGKPFDAYKKAFMVRAKALRAAGSNINENKFVSAASMSRAVKCEIHVLHYYIRSCGLLDHLLPGLTHMKALIAEFFPTWFVFETSTNTARHRGHYQRLLYFLDDKIQLADENAFTNLFRAHGVRCPEVVARHALEYADERFALARKIDSLMVDEVEHAMLCQLLLARSAVKVNAIDTETASAYTQKVLRQLHDHSTSIYADSITRTGNILLMLNDVENVRHWYEEHLTMIGLGGREAIWRSCLEHWTPATTLSH